MPTPIVTSDLQIYRSPQAVCYVSDTLAEEDFVESDLLKCESLRIVCAPGIDQASLSFIYGDLIPEFGDTWEYLEPKDLEGKFVKIVITDTIYEDAFDADPDTTEEDLSITWYGIIEHDERPTSGTTPEDIVTPADGNHARGEQYFVAFGLLRLLEKEVIDTSYVDIDGTTPNRLKIQRGLPFNSDPGGEFIRRGNRSAAKVGDSYIYSWTSRGEDIWTAHNAVEYLLTYQSPRNAAGVISHTWRLDSDIDYLDWYDIDLNTDGKTVKAVLDDLIPRQRAVGYWVDFDVSLDGGGDPKNEIVLHVFTMVDTDITLPSGETLKANPDQYELDYEHALDITEAIVADSGMAKYDRIIARGERRTTTFTARLASAPSFNESLCAAWTTDTETAYVDAASGDADYGTLTDKQKQARNAITRSAEEFSDVFTRFHINPNIDSDRWDCVIKSIHESSVHSYYLTGDASVEPFDAAYVTDVYRREHIPSLRVLRALPLYERLDYSGSSLSTFVYSDDVTEDKHPSFIRPFVYALTDGDAFDYTLTSNRYELLDKLNRSWTAAGDRTWSARVGVLDTEPGIEVRASVQHFLSGNSVSGWAIMADHENQEINKGIQFTHMFATICVELNEHIQAEEVLTEPVDPDTKTPERVLIIFVPKARHDYVIPYTTVDIQGGVPVRTTSGGFAKNDLPRLQTIARAAAEWYSTKRRTLQLSFRQVRRYFGLGWLITDVGGAYNWTNINTVVTSITYNMGRDNQPGSTSIETSYADLDFNK